MGAWGTGFFQNDTAMDWYGEFMAELVDKVESTIATERDNHLLLAAAAFLDGNTRDPSEGDEWYAVGRRWGGVELTGWARDRKLFTRAAKTVREIALDNEWVNDWKRPEEVRTLLEALATSLESKATEYEEFSN